ncbi:hypothetical protein D3C85_1187470 [compost metagenome]
MTANGSRCLLGNSLELADLHMLVDGHGDSHIVQHTIGRNRSVRELGVNSLGIEQASFDIEKAVIAFIAAANHLPGV